MKGCRWKCGGSGTTKMTASVVFVWILLVIPAFSREPRLRGSFNNKECSYEVLSRSGSITSPYYPQLYQNNTNCLWRIKGRIGDVVTLNITDIDIEEDEDPCHQERKSISGRPHCCHNNWLKVGSYGDTDLRFLCGRNIRPQPYVAHASDVYVKFHTSLSVRGGRGFNITYTIDSALSVICTSNEFRCKDGNCVLLSWRCNGQPECSDGSDEDDCPQNNICLENKTTCGMHSLECYDPNSQRCDRVINCANGADEMSCVAGCQDKIMCSSWIDCFPPIERCNGMPHCVDDSDEKNCTPDLCNSEHGNFLCGNRRCVRESWRCDQTNDCDDNTDEANCVKNSVITAAVMGSLICGLLLVIAVGCTCKLYALRYPESLTHPPPIMPMSRLEQELMRREPPPPYSIAVATPPLPIGYYGHIAAPSQSPSSGRDTMLSVSQAPPLLQPSVFSDTYRLVRPTRIGSRRTRRARRHHRAPSPPRNHPTHPLESSNGVMVPHTHVSGISSVHSNRGVPSTFGDPLQPQPIRAAQAFGKYFFPRFEFGRPMHVHRESGRESDRPSPCVNYQRLVVSDQEGGSSSSDISIRRSSICTASSIACDMSLVNDVNTSITVLPGIQFENDDEPLLDSIT